MMKAKLILQAYPFAASEEGLWLLHDPIDSDALAAGYEPDDECNLLEYRLDIPPVLRVDHHQTSSRMDKYNGFWNYAIAAIAPEGVSVKERWPQARGIPNWWLQDDLPVPHEPGEPPWPRYKDVMRHALRHLAFLVRYDQPAWQGYPPIWREQLAEVRPALYRMFGRDGRYPAVAAA